jgi:D-glycero-D-manno-heptose 1,7-bisphosphate phosphatase
VVGLNSSEFQPKAGLRALFLDRDGVINVEKNYLYRIDDFEFIEGIFEICNWAVTNNFAIVVVTNQAGIARGYYTEKDFEHLTKWMCEQFSERGIKIDSVQYCPFHPEYGLGSYRRDSDLRKPKPGMILRAAESLGLNLPESILIGDKLSDIAAARAAGVGCAILMGNLEIAREKKSSDNDSVPDYAFESMNEILNFLHQCHKFKTI